MPLPKWHTNRSWLWIALALSLLIFYAAKFPVGQHIDLGFAPMVEALHAPANWWQKTSLWFKSRKELQNRLAEAETAAQKQASLTQEVLVLREENRQLRNLLSLGVVATGSWRGAKVIGRSPDLKSSRILLLIKGAQRDDVVASEEGLVGIVDTASQNHAVVRTILDASIAVPVTLAGSDLAALVRGEGDHLVIDFIPEKQAPKIGAVLQTSGVGGVYPAGIPVARVLAVKHIHGQMFVRIKAIPVAHWQQDSWLAVDVPQSKVQ